MLVAERDYRRDQCDEARVEVDRLNEIWSDVEGYVKTGLIALNVVRFAFYVLRFAFVRSFVVFVVFFLIFPTPRHSFCCFAVPLVYHLLQPGAAGGVPAVKMEQNSGGRQRRWRCR